MPMSQASGDSQPHMLKNPQGNSLKLDYQPGHIGLLPGEQMLSHIPPGRWTSQPRVWRLLGLEAGHQHGTTAVLVALGTVCLHLESLYITQMLGSMGSSHKVSRAWLLLSHLWLNQGGNRRPRDLDLESVQTLIIVILLLSALWASSFIHSFTFFYLLSIPPLCQKRFQALGTQ